MTMIRQGRSFFGIAALLCLVLFLNILVWKQAFFSPAVLLPLGLSLLFFIGWLICLAAALAEHRAIEGRTAGGLGAAVSTILFLGICIVLYLFLSAWKVSWDLTEEGRRSLSTQTVQVLQSMNTEVEVLCFFLQVEEELVTIARDKTLRFLDACREHTSLMKVEMLDPTIDRARLEAMNITHASVQGTIVLRAGDRQRVILLTGGSPRLEERDFTNALINVLRKSEPKVYFLTGHRERDILEEDEQSGASIFGKLLQGEAYQVDRLGIKISDPEIPMDADVLVINNPGMDFHPVEIEALNQFMDRG
ncbi:MAG TPA: Gldg family protein, partial [Candidatus Hydrogenedentes bacterium]|nr:Gldg family protein [Candidatus Hydrogenedentota bacterium]